MLGSGNSTVTAGTYESSGLNYAHSVVVSVFGGAGSLDDLGGGAQLVLASGAATVAGGSTWIDNGLPTQDVTLFGGSGSLDFTGGNGIIVLGSGNATIDGGTSNNTTIVFGGSKGFEYDGKNEHSSVIGGGGSDTIQAGTQGGWYSGGSAGNNLLLAGAGGTVLQGVANGDTLVGSASGGTFFLAGAGNETLRGGNATGVNAYFLGAGNADVTLDKGGSIVVAGTGMASIQGGGYYDQVFLTPGGTNTITPGLGGTMLVQGFQVGVDHITAGGQAVTSTVSGNGSTTIDFSTGGAITLYGVTNAAPGSVFS